MHFSLQSSKAKNGTQIDFLQEKPQRRSPLTSNVLPISSLLQLERDGGLSLSAALPSIMEVSLDTHTSQEAQLAKYIELYPDAIDCCETETFIAVLTAEGKVRARPYVMHAHAFKLYQRVKGDANAVFTEIDFQNIKHIQLSFDSTYLLAFSKVGFGVSFSPADSFQDGRVFSMGLSPALNELISSCVSRTYVFMT
jgi:hypothetical protein